MELSVNKCKVMHVGNRIDGSDLIDVSFEKDLGVWVDNPRVR